MIRARGQNVQVLNTLHVFDDGKTIVGKHVGACRPFLFVGQREDRPMAATSTYEELQQRVRELEKKCAERKLSQERSERLDSLKEALRDSEARYRTLIDATQAAVVVHDSDTRIVEANKTAERLLGFSKDQLLGKAAADPAWNFLSEDGSIMPPEEYPVNQVLARGTSLRGFVEGIRHPNSHDTTWALVNADPVADVDGKVSQVIVTFVDITEHKRAEQELARSEERHRQLVQHAPSAICEVDYRNRRFISFNEVVPAYTGYSEEELKEIDIIDLFTDYGKETFYKRLERMKAGKEVPGSQEYEIRKKDGTTIWALINANYEMEGGMPVRGTLVAHDITARKAMESALKESEENYRTLFDNAADAILVLDPGGTIVDVNKRFEEESGYSRDEMMGKDFFTGEIIAKASIGNMRLSFEKLLQGQEWQILEADGVRKDGGIVPYEIRAVSVKKNGDVAAVQAVLRNVRERKEAGKVLRMEKEKFEVLVERSPLAVSLVGQDGQYKYINPKFVDTFGYTLQDIPHGREWFTRAYPDPKYREKVISAWIGDMKESKIGDPRPRVFDVTCKDGSKKVIHFRPVTMPNGDQLIICEDITEQRRLERQLRQSHKMEAIGTLAGGIAHDFNNILTPIIVQTEVAMHLLPKDNPVQHNLEEVTKASHRAKDLVKQILTFGRQSEQHRLPLKISPVLKETMKLLRSSLPSTIEMRQNINVELDVAMTDPTEIHQVLMNLCTNAAHAMGKVGGGILEVSLTDMEIGTGDGDQYPDLKPGPYLRLSVRDTGHGMDQATMERIFDPFFTTKNRDEGTGIVVESEPGKGTTFHVFFQRLDSKAVTRTEPAGPVPGGSERILLVDDDKAVVDTVQLMLEYLGYDVVAKLSGVAALKAFEAHPDEFDLVITDQTMPRMTGTELARKLVAIRPHLPVVLFTGFGHQMKEAELKASGISAHLLKPLVMDDMAKIVRKVIDRNSSG
jgi:PAS domain S-box-containing protein